MEDPRSCDAIRVDEGYTLRAARVKPARSCPNRACIVHATESLDDIDRLADDYCRPCGAIVARTVRDLAEGFPLEPER